MDLIKKKYVFKSDLKTDFAGPELLGFSTAREPEQRKVSLSWC